jgi:hypothetical protein
MFFKFLKPQPQKRTSWKKAQMMQFKTIWISSSNMDTHSQRNFTNRWFDYHFRQIVGTGMKQSDVVLQTFTVAYKLTSENFSKN